MLQIMSILNIDLNQIDIGFSPVIQSGMEVNLKFLIEHQKSELTFDTIRISLLYA